MRPTFVVLTAAALMTMTGCAGVTQKSLEEKGLKRMTERQLQERYSRPVRVRFVNAQNQTGTAEYLPDGSARLSWQGGGDTGKWTIKNGMFCTQYKEVRKGTENCFISYQTGPKEYVSFNTDGSYNGTATEID